MVDVLRSGIGFAESIITGLAGGFAYSVVRDGLPSVDDFALMAVVIVLFMLFVISLHRYYEEIRGESHHP